MKLTLSHLQVIAAYSFLFSLCLESWVQRCSRKKNAVRTGEQTLFPPHPRCQCPLAAVTHVYSPSGLENHRLTFLQCWRSQSEVGFTGLKTKLLAGLRPLGAWEVTASQPCHLVEASHLPQAPPSPGVFRHCSIGRLSCLLTLSSFAYKDLVCRNDLVISLGCISQVILF
jgi:hypothetical protein